MEDMENNPIEINTSPRDDCSEVSDFIKIEQEHSSESSINTNLKLGDVEKNSEGEKKPQPVSEVKPEEQTYQDILGSGDLTKKIIKPGNLEDRPTRGEQITINLVGRLENDDDIIQEENNLEITLGDCEVILCLRIFFSYLNFVFYKIQVIQGVDLALSLMNVGEIAELKIASRFGYGDKGLEPKIMSKAKLVYTVELVSIQPELVPDSLSTAERLRIGFVHMFIQNLHYFTFKFIITIVM